MMKRLAVLVGALALLMFLALPAHATSAPKATGSIVMSDPLQAARFDAFATLPTKGSVTYTNFTYPDPGSGVWIPAGTFPMDFSLDGYGYAATYQQTIDSVVPTSPTAIGFTGHGDSGVGWYSSFNGTIHGTAFGMTMVEYNAVESYTLVATGTIATDGSIAGTWSDDYGGGRTGTFAIAAGAIHEVLSYTADVGCVRVSGNAATFDFVIPTGSLAGTPVVVDVTDGGSPGIYDTWSHAVGTCDVPGALTSYPITAGNLVVH